MENYIKVCVTKDKKEQIISHYETIIFHSGGVDYVVNLRADGALCVAKNINGNTTTSIVVH